ncbi:hypothetical protein BGZ83_002227 [Gryganskiella cystojenkinii]|nr:hypothetical protein BGZ83_002227 [Gryganskiella cystojenkinii]
MVKSWSSFLGLVPTLTAVTTLLSLVSYTSAQAPNPIPVSVEEMASVRAGSRLYINGGSVYKNNNLTLSSGQFFSLDLSQSWDVNSAPWQALSSTSPNIRISMVASPDNKTIYRLALNVDDGTVELTNYNIGTDAWDSSIVSLPYLKEDRQGMRAIMDPNTRVIYMNGPTNLNIYNLNASKFSTQLLPTYVLKSRYYGGGVYNKLRNSLMYFGGWYYNKNKTVQFDPLATYVSEYNLTAKTWANVSTTGIPPPVRSDFCMAVNEDGSKVVVYGGRVAVNDVFARTFFILDVTTGQWTQGPDGDVRAYMACTIVGDQFLAWGGSPGKTTWDTPPRIFDMTLLKWTTTYKAPAYYLNTPKSSSMPRSPSSTTLPNAGGNSSPSSSSNNLGAILGGTFGGLFVLASTGVIFVCLKRRENRIKNGLLSEKQQQQKNREKKYKSATMLPTSESELRNPQEGMVGAQESQLRNPQEGMLGAQDSELRNPHSPIISTTGGYTPYTHLSSPMFSNCQQSTAFEPSTEMSQQQSDVYRAQYHPGATGTATPDGNSTAAGSPAYSDSLVYTTAPKDPNIVPPHAYNNNAYSVPVVQDPASIATSFSGASAPVNVSEFVPPPPPSSDPIDISGIIYTSSPETSQVSPPLPSSAEPQTPVTAYREFRIP